MVLDAINVALRIIIFINLGQVEGDCDGSSLREMKYFYITFALTPFENAVPCHPLSVLFDIVITLEERGG